ncbi:MAG TPA: hypothetical protein VFH29_09155 [Anaerolineales bacterium]|nr:hypothetical protein [Anaerolineales bacterium]
MFTFQRGARILSHGVENLAIVLTSNMLEWLRELPTRRALHMLKLIAELLRKHREVAWPGRLEELAANLRAAQDSGDRDRLVDAMNQILACFSGVASLNNLQLSPHAGNRIKPEEVEPANARLGALRTQLHLSARQTIARIEWQRRRA